MNKSRAALCIVFGIGACLLQIGSGRADDLGRVLNELAVLKQENAALRERVQRLEKRRDAEPSYTARPLGQTKIVALAGQPEHSDIIYKKVPSTPPSSFNWTGLYIGGHFGQGWQSTSIDDPFSVGVVFSSVSAEPIRTFYPRNFLGGAQVGWNYQVAHLVVGNEISISLADLKGGRSDSLFISGTPAPGETITTMETRIWDSRTNWLGTATARFGYAWDRLLAYTKGGIAVSRNRYDFVDNTSGTTTGLFPSSTAATNAQIGFDTRIGWTVGAGLEWGLSPKWSVMAEYDYMDFGSKPVATFGTFTATCTGACTAFPSVSSTFLVTPIELRIQTVRFGLNYRFGGPAETVVVGY
jgi:outer membrane immunogenic protein